MGEINEKNKARRGREREAERERQKEAGIGRLPRVGWFSPDSADVAGSLAVMVGSERSTVTLVDSNTYYILTFATHYPKITLVYLILFQPAVFSILEAIS